MRAALLLVLLASAGLPARADPPTGARNVVVLYQFEPSLPVTIELSRGIRSILEQPGVALSPEYLDHARFDGSHGARDLARWYAAKYAGQRVDLVLAVGSETLEFLLESRNQLWRDVPVVFCDAFNGADASARLPSGVTGLRIDVPVKENLDLILQLLPRTRRVAFIGGTSRIDRGLGRLFWDEVRAYDRRLEVTDLTGLTYEEVRDRLAVLPDGTVAFGLSMLRDGAGRQLSGHTYVEMFAERSRVPIFAAIDTVLGHGIVGGRLLSYSQIGREVALVARRVLDGQAPESIPVGQSAAAHLAFDARQLERWKIPASRLPAGSEVLFRPPPPFYSRPAAIIALAVALLLEAALIGTLLLERRRRHRSERESRDDRARIAHMNRVAVVGELTATLAHEVSTPLAAMMNDARAARRCLEAPAARLEDARASIRAVEEQGQRARDVLQQMRRALRKESAQPAFADLSAAVRDAVRLVQSDAREHGATVEAAFPTEGPKVQCDPVQLQQVLINLLLNALDAVRGQPPERCRVRVDVQAGPDHAEVVVRDWGCGVPPESRARLFEAFHTTKPNGVGMGLSISRSIVEAHGGRIALQPTGDIGAAFHFFLPLASAQPRPALRAL